MMLLLQLSLSLSLSLSLKSVLGICEAGASAFCFEKCKNPKTEMMQHLLSVPLNAVRAIF
jgi:hypothetical protein